MRPTLAAFTLAVILCGSVLCDSTGRWIPEHCLDHGQQSAPAAGDADRRWNDSYRRGIRAIEREEYALAESEMCQALLAARGFDPRDWRFAETLDELGLIAFQLRDFDLAERMQGAAIAEMLLAVGPRGEPLGDRDLRNTVIRPDCRSGIQAYTTRLGWIHERIDGRTTTAEIRDAPWLVFAAGYVPLDADSVRRLDWLVSQYLLQENLAAAEALTELQRSLRNE